MKKLVITMTLLLTFSVQTRAGEIPGDRTPPPPCTENCTTTTASTDGTEETALTPIEVIEIVLVAITFRP